MLIMIAFRVCMLLVGYVMFMLAVGAPRLSTQDRLGPIGGCLVCLAIMLMYKEYWVYQGIGVVLAQFVLILPASKDIAKKI